MTESSPADQPDEYLEACRVDAEALLACVVFALHNPPAGRRPPDALADSADLDLDERMRAFMEYEDDEARTTGRWPA